MIFLTGCATGSSDRRLAIVCPPVVEYSREEQRRVAEEVEAVPKIAPSLNGLPIMLCSPSMNADSHQRMTMRRVMCSKRSIPSQVGSNCNA